VVKADGTVIGYGDNTFGQITIPASATNVVAVAAGDFYGLALRSDGVVIGWPSDDPIPPIATNVIAISAGRFHWLALKADGSVVGSVDIPDSATNVVAIATGFGYSLAARADGSVCNSNFWITSPVRTSRRTNPSKPFGALLIPCHSAPFTSQSAFGRCSSP